MDSMPPATITVAWPAESSSKAIIAAFMPEPHILFTVVAGVVLSSPAPSAAWRAGAWPWPAGSTQPKIRSSTSPGLTPACSTAALIADRAELGGGDGVELALHGADGGALGADDDDAFP